MNTTIKNRTMPIASSKDKLNKAIVVLLQQDGRMPFAEIAGSLNVSEGTIRNRVNSMKQAGALRIAALADPGQVEYKTDAIVGLTVASSSTPALVASRLGEFTEVVFILWVSGRFDLLVEIVSDHRNEYLDFLENSIYSQTDIDNVEIMSGLKNFKNQFLLKGNWS